MGFTGLIFAAIAVVWLAYLIPLYLRRRSPVDEVEAESVDRFTDSMRIIRSGTAPLVDMDGAEIPSVEVSTPLTRRAAMDDLCRQERAAAARRRRVLVFLAVALTAVIVVCALGLIDWIWVAAPGGVLLGFFVVARFSVRAMHRHLDRRRTQINTCSDESTVFMRRSDLDALVSGGGREKTRDAIEVTRTVRAGKPATGALWDPLPITLPTYVSKPLAPRTVRTIDLSGPDVTSSGRSTSLGSEVPVTADAPIEAAPDAAPEGPATAEGQLRRAVGE